MQPDMNSAIRNAGNRTRRLPNIGQVPLAQTPAVQAANIVMPGGAVGGAGGAGAAGAGGGAGAAGAGGAAGAAQAMQGIPQGMPPQMPPQQQQSPYGAPNIGQPTTMTMHPPGTPADPNQYNYEPQPDGAWRVYPPGVNAPPHQPQASLPRAASTADYRRMRQAFQAPPQF